MVSLKRSRGARDAVHGEPLDFRRPVVRQPPRRDPVHREALEHRVVRLEEHVGRGQRPRQRRLERQEQRHRGGDDLSGATNAGREPGLVLRAISRPLHAFDENDAARWRARQTRAERDLPRAVAARRPLPQAVIGLRPERHDLGRAFGHERQELPHEGVRRRDATLERIVRVRLAQHRDAVAEPDVVGAEARARIVGRPPARGIVLRDEVPIVERLDAMPRAHAFAERRQQRVARVDSAEEGRRIERWRVRERVAVEAAVGGVEVHEHIGVPRVDDGERCDRLRRLRLDVVAIEIEALRVGTLAHQRRAVLLAAVLLLRRELLVAVGVVDRKHEDVERVGDTRARRERQIADECLRGFLSLHFTGVDVGLDEHDRPPIAPAPRLISAIAPAIDAHERDVAPLGRPADHGHENRRAADPERVEKEHHVGVTRRLRVSAALGARARERRRGRRAW